MLYKLFDAIVIRVVGGQRKSWKPRNVNELKNVKTEKNQGITEFINLRKDYIIVIPI